MFVPGQVITHLCRLQLEKSDRLRQPIMDFARQPGALCHHGVKFDLRHQAIILHHEHDLTSQSLKQVEMPLI